MINWGKQTVGAVLPFPFASYGKTNGESITLTGLAVTDIEVYKGTSMTQRASDNGYALMDTDGIDLDGTTGVHGFSIDTSDNSDAGFYAAGSKYWVVVSAVTVDAQTVSFIAGTFELVAADPTVQDIVDAIWNELRSAHVAAGSFGELLGKVPTGSVVSDGSNSATTFKTDRTEATDNYFKDAYLLITSGVLEGQVKKISAYTGATKFVTVQDGFTGTPASGVTFVILNR